MQLKSTPPEPTPCQLVQNWALDPGAWNEIESLNISIGREGGEGLGLLPCADRLEQEGHMFIASGKRWLQDLGRVDRRPD